MTFLLTLAEGKVIYDASTELQKNKGKKNVGTVCDLPAKGGFLVTRFDYTGA